MAIVGAMGRLTLDRRRVAAAIGGLAGACTWAFVLAAGVSTSCGDTCVVLTNGARDATEWTVTIAADGAARIESVEGDVSVIIHCNGDCHCSSQCDCNADWVRDADGVACEPLIPATLATAATGERGLHFELAGSAAATPPADLFSCTYRSDSAPDAADFEIRLTGSSAGSADAAGTLPRLMVRTASRDIPAR